MENVAGFGGEGGWRGGSGYVTDPRGLAGKSAANAARRGPRELTRCCGRVTGACKIPADAGKQGCSTKSRAALAGPHASPGITLRRAGTRWPERAGHEVEAEKGAGQSTFRSSTSNISVD